MLDLKNKEPRIEIFYPLLIHYSPEAAVLYGYLKNVYNDSFNKIKFRGENGLVLKLKRFEIEEKTGLSIGQQIDAEKDLIGAGLANGLELRDQLIEYAVFPKNEDRLRRFVNAYRHEWKI